MNDDLLKSADLGKIVSEGSKIYEEIKDQYESSHKGEFLAIEIETKKAYLASSSAEAMVAARSENPGKIFYVMKIGFDAAETMAHFSSIK
jgi:hypothetical protein